MTDRSLVVDKFMGGVSSYLPEKILDGECAIAQNVIDIEGTLRTWSGRAKYTATEILAGIVIRSAYRFYKSGVGYTLAVSGLYLWWTNGTAHRAICNLGETANHWKFAPAGGSLYFVPEQSPAVTKNMPIRWDGSIYSTGTVRCTGDTTIEGNGTAWVAGGIGSCLGYALMVEQPAGVWTTLRIVTVTDATHLVVAMAGPDTSTAWVNYCIVPVHPGYVGAPTLADMPVATLTAGVGGGTLGTGTYKYYMTFVSRTGYESNPYYINSVQTTSPDAVLVGGPVIAAASLADANHFTWQVISANIYRTKVNGEQPFKVGTIARTGAAFTFGDLTDIMPDTSPSLGAEVKEDHDVPLPATSKLYSDVLHWNDRLHMVVDNELHFSEYSKSEYWRLNQHGAEDPVTLVQAEGGYATFGDPGSRIMAIVGEGSAFAVTGVRGSHLLVLTEREAYRWAGMFQYQFKRLDAFSEGAVSNRCTARWKNLIFWITRKGPVMFEIGTSQPQPIHEKIFPSDSNPFIGQVATPSSTYKPLEIIQGIVWRDYYIFAYPSTAYNGVKPVCDTVWLYHIPSGTFRQLGTQYLKLKVSDLITFDALTDTGGLYACDHEYGYIWQLFAGTNLWDTGAGVTWHWRDRLRTLAETQAEVYKSKGIKQISICVIKPASTQSIVVNLYGNGNTTTPIMTAVTVTTNTGMGAVAGTGERIMLDVFPAAHARSIQVDFSGIATATVEIPWFEVLYEINPDRMESIRIPMG